MTDGLHAPIIENSKKKKNAPFRNMFPLLNRWTSRTVWVHRIRSKWAAYPPASCCQCSPGSCCCSSCREAARDHHRQHWPEGHHPILANSCIYGRSEAQLAEQGKAQASKSKEWRSGPHASFVAWTASGSKSEAGFDD